MQKTTIEKFIKETLNINPLDIKENVEINIKEHNKKILSFNHEKQENELKLVTKIIRKENDYPVFIKTVNKNIINCTKDHKFFVKFKETEFFYLKVNDILFLLEKGEKVSIKTKNNEYDSIDTWYTGSEKIPIFDLEVEDNHNFYSNELLSHNSFGNPITVSGGTAIPFYSHVRIWVTRSEIDKELGKNKIKFNFVKNKMAVPFKLGVTLYDWTNGFDVASEMGDIALECGIITISGKTYTLPGVDKPIVGKKATIQYLQDNPQYVKEQIEPLVKAYLETNSEVVSEPDVQ